MSNQSAGREQIVGKSGLRQANRFYYALESIRHVIVRDQAVLSFLAAAFLARLFLADWNSYWNDEILSVFVHGSWNDTLGDSVRVLGEGSVHPPLYQVLLYAWMSAFGVGEIATRTLSNIAVTLSAYVLYRMTLLAWSRTASFMVSASYTVMAVSITYGLEARSYGLTILLSVVSMATLFNIMVRLKSPSLVTREKLTGSIVLLLAANVGLMMTHYYNVFFLIAQAIIFLIFSVIEFRGRARWSTLLWGAGLSFVAPLVFLVSWGPTLFSRFGALSDSFEVEGDSPSSNFWSLFSAVSFRENISSNPWVAVVLTAVFIFIVGYCLWSVVLRKQKPPVMQSWLYIVLFSWATLPIAVTLATFAVTGLERYSTRYFVFAAPPLTALIILGILIAAKAIPAGKMATESRSVLAYALAAIAILVLVIPMGLNAAAERKHDWRGNVARVVQTVESAPDENYFVVEVGFQQRSRAEYYFERFSRTTRADTVFLMAEERDGRYDRLLTAISPEYDRVLVFFNHIPARRVPGLLTELDMRFDRVHAQLDRNGRGYIVWDRD